MFFIIITINIFIYREKNIKQKKILFIYYFLLNFNCTNDIMF